MPAWPGAHQRAIIAGREAGHATTRVPRWHWRSGGVAGCGEGAAAGRDAGDRISRHGIARPVGGQSAAIPAGLSQTGHVDCRNVRIEYRWAEGHNDRLPTLAADLVQRQVAVIAIPGGVQSAVAAKSATSTIPIVFQLAGDPVALGLVTSLNRPGGNVTGFSSLNVEVGAKRLELLHEAIPTVTAMAFLFNPSNPAADALLRDAQAAARMFGLQLHVLHATSESDIDAAFVAIPRLRVGGLVIGTDPLFTVRSDRIGALALHQRVPAIFAFREFVVAGGLMSYGGNTADQYRQVGVYTGRILKGEKPADLPVQQATKVELIINMKTAKALGLTFPLTLLGRADEVIE
jgi:putative ABC transport system substrate-binding protein